MGAEQPPPDAGAYLEGLKELGPAAEGALVNLRQLVDDGTLPSADLDTLRAIRQEAIIISVRLGQVADTAGRLGALTEQRQASLGGESV